MKKVEDKAISQPTDKFWAFYIYFRHFILALFSIVLIILILYPLLKDHLFSPQFILIIILLIVFAIFSFILFIGTLKAWKWVKIAEYIFVFIATALFVRHLVGGEINFYDIRLLIFLVLSGIILFAIWINKLLHKRPK